MEAGHGERRSGVNAFVVDHAVLRWGAVAAFVITATIVLARLAVVPGEGGVAKPAGQESDAAHLLMCLVMVAMLTFPLAAAHEAVHAVLTAMVVAYAVLLVQAAGQRPRDSRRAGALLYHLLTAAAMSFAMGGHNHGAPHRPPVVPLVLLAVLFVTDAVLLVVPRTRNLVWHTVSHSPGRTGRVALVPHLVMDLGTAYMMVAVVMS
jgi:hypothetical protein